MLDGTTNWRLVGRVFFLSIVISACLPFVSTVLAGDLLFKRHVINEKSDYSAAALIDVNQDGHTDIVCGGDWYEGPHWKKHFVAEIPRIRGRPDGFSHLEFDVNRDGWVDVITVNYRSRSIKWMEHPGKSLGPWTIHTAVEPGPMETGRLVDVDGDGQLDLLPNGARFAAWWEFRWKDAKSPGEPAWIRHDLPMEAGGHGLGFGDVDGDGRGDIVGQNGWLQAPADVRAGQWRWYPEFKIERGSIPMIVFDVDQDGDSDVVWCSAHGFGVYWLEQDKKADGKRYWKRHAIDTSWSQGHSPLLFDMDGDGRKELITGKRYMAHGGFDPGEYDPIAIYRYQFNGETRAWDRWVMSPHGQRVGVGLDPKVADIDSDGDLDLMASGRSGLYWLENLGTRDDSRKSPETPTYDDHLNLLVVQNADGDTRIVDEPEAWGRRRSHIVESIEHAHGAIPGCSLRIPLDIIVQSDSAGESYKSQRIRYRIDSDRQVSATLLTPKSASRGTAAGLVCMFDPAHARLADQIASELAVRGFVCLVPELAATDREDHLPDFVWQAMRGADVLQSSDRVHGERIGFVGDALQGQLGLYVAAHDQRFIATLTDASRSADLIALSKTRTYSLAELLACAAPRSLNIVLPSDAAAASAIKKNGETAAAVFQLRKVTNNLLLNVVPWYSDDRQTAYEWLQSKFRR